jgi:fucose permease
MPTLCYYAAYVGLGLSAASMGPTLAGLAEHTQSRLSEISFLFVARSLGYMLGSLLGGRLYDRVPGHRLMMTALCVMAAMLVVAAGMPLLWALTILLLILGLGEGTLDVGGNTLLIWVHGRQVGPFMNGLHFCYGLGAFLSPIVVAQLVLLSGDITWAYWAIAVLLLPAIILLWRPPSPSMPAPDAKHSRPAKPVQRGLVALIAVFFFLHVGAEAAYGGWAFTYAVTQGLGNATLAAYLTSAYWGALMVGRLLSIPIAARFSAEAILMGDLLGCLASLGIVALFPTASPALWLGTFGLGLSIASLYPMTLCLGEQRMRITGRVTGWFLVGGSIGSMFLPWLIGQLFEPVGPRVVIGAIAAALAAAVAVLLVIGKRPALTLHEGPIMIVPIHEGHEDR